MNLPAACPALDIHGIALAWSQALLRNCWMHQCTGRSVAPTGLCADHIEELRYETNR